MTRPLRDVVVATLAAMALAGCGEKAPRADPERHVKRSNDVPQHPAYERTLEQGESERMGR